MFRYAVTLSSFKDIEGIEQTLERISGLGFDALEMYGEPEMINIKRPRELFDSHQIKICGVTGMWGRASKEGEERRLLSSDPALQRRAKEYVKQCVRMCHALGGAHLNVCLFADDDLSFFDSTHRAFQAERKKSIMKRAVPILSELAKFTADYGVRLLLEPLNRYSTPYFSTARDALKIVKEVDNDWLRMMLDTFHMNIEEDAFDIAIAEAKDFLRHMHFADNNRKMPGYGHIDFKTIVGSLANSGYRGYITFEPTIRDSTSYERPLRNGLGFTRSLETIHRDTN